MKAIVSAGVLALAVLLAGEAQAQTSRETAAVRVGVDVPLFGALASVTVRPWRLLEVEADAGAALLLGPGWTAGVRTGIAYPLHAPDAKFQVDTVALVGYREMVSRIPIPACPADHPCGSLWDHEHLATATLGLDLTYWTAPSFALTGRINAGGFVRLTTVQLLVLPELGTSIGVAF